MDEVMKGEPGALFIFLYLLPGFLGAVVYNYLVERPEPSNFERIIDALVLTLVSSLLAHFLFHSAILPPTSFAKGDAVANVLSEFLTRDLIFTALSSVFLSTAFAYLNNHDILYSVLRWLKLTYKTGDNDVWKDTFYKHRGYWVTLRYSDGRCLLGWPKYFSETDKPRELFVADATWLYPDEDGELTSVDVAGPGVYISDFKDVVSIELLE